MDIIKVLIAGLGCIIIWILKVIVYIVLVLVGGKITSVFLNMIGIEANIYASILINTVLFIAYKCSRRKQNEIS